MKAAKLFCILSLGLATSSIFADPAPMSSITFSNLSSSNASLVLLPGYARSDACTQYYRSYSSGTINIPANCSFTAYVRLANSQANPCKSGQTPIAYILKSSTAWVSVNGSNGQYTCNCANTSGPCPLKVIN